MPNHETYAYSASKAGLHHLSRHLAGRLGHQGITSNTIACGPFESKSESLRPFASDSAPQGLMHRFCSDGPHSRNGERYHRRPNTPFTHRLTRRCSGHCTLLVVKSRGLCERSHNHRRRRLVGIHVDCEALTKFHYLLTATARRPHYLSHGPNGNVCIECDISTCSPLIQSPAGCKIIK